RVDGVGVFEHVRQVRILGEELPAGGDEGGAEVLDDAAAVVVVGVERGDLAHAEPLVGPARERGPVQQVARADPEDPGPGVGEERAARRRRDGDDAPLVVVVDLGGGERGGGVDVADDGDDARVVAQLGGDLDGAFGAGLVVPDDELDEASAHAAGAVDLVHGQLGGEPHRVAGDLPDGAGDGDADGAGIGTAADDAGQGRGEGEGGDPDPAPGVQHRSP